MLTILRRRAASEGGHLALLVLLLICTTSISTSTHLTSLSHSIGVVQALAQPAPLLLCRADHCGLELTIVSHFLYDEEEDELASATRRGATSPRTTRRRTTLPRTASRKATLQVMNDHSFGMIIQMNDHSIIQMNDHSYG